MATRAREIVVITGGTAGVGRATAREFAGRGADVAVIARGADALEATRREIEEFGVRALALSADVADAAAIEGAAEQVEKSLGPIDVWVNNAMASVFSPVAEMTPEEYRRVTEVTYLGVVHGTLAALRRMRPRDRGVIVQVGSTLAHRAIPLQSAYCAAKHAVKGFTESLRTELKHDRSGVRVTLVHLPALNTPQFDWVKHRLPGRPQPLGPIFQPEVAARAIVWASAHDRRELFVGWPVVKAVTANKFAPGLIDSYLARVGYGQHTEEPDPPDRPDNLWAPLPGDAGAHGRFDARAKPYSLQSWASRHRGWLAAAAAVGTGAWLSTVARRRLAR